MLRKAKVHVLPIHSGDGYGYGGGCYTVPRVRWTPYGYRRVLVERCY